jgi:Hyaluronidase
MVSAISWVTIEVEHFTARDAGHDESETPVTITGIRTMLQALPVIQRFFSTKTAIFLCGVLAVAGSLGAPADVLAAVGGSCFQVYDALLFTNKPDLRIEGLEPAAVVAPARWLPSGQSVNQIPDESSIRIGLGTSGAASGILVLDEEDWPNQGTTAIVGASVNKYLTLLSRVRQVGLQGPIGYYGVLPNRDYWRAIGLPSSQPYLAWQSENDLLQPVADAVDVLFPSIYTFYDDQDGWTRYAIANLSEARRLARGKPVYAFIWPQYHESNKTLGLTLISGTFWALQLQTVAKYADGVVIWGGYQMLWNEQAAWWQATRQFLRTSPQICSSPNAPSSLRAHP